METIQEQEQVATESQHRNRLDKCFFGKESALKIQYDKENNKIYLGIGKKGSNNDWTWEKAKLKDIEAAEILRVIASKTEAASFFHTFNNKNTKIWINKNEDSLIIKVDDQSKKLNPAEQEVLRIFLEEVILQTFSSQKAASSSESRSQTQSSN